MSELREKIIRKQGACFNGITESMHSHIDGNDLVFRSDVHKVFKQILPEIISMVIDEAIEAVKNNHIGEKPDGMMRFGANEAIKAIEKLKD